MSNSPEGQAGSGAESASSGRPSTTTPSSRSSPRSATCASSTGRKERRSTPPTSRAGSSGYEIDPYGGEIAPREPINDTVEVLFIGGGFSALLTSARLREVGVETIRIVERGADVGGTWYWNRYPGVACDVVSYDYLPLLDEMNYVPSRHYAKGPEIFAHCQAIARPLQPVRAGGVPDHRDLDGVGRGRAAVARRAPIAATT